MEHTLHYDSDGNLIGMDGEEFIEKKTRETKIHEAIEYCKRYEECSKCPLAKMNMICMDKDFNDFTDEELDGALALFELKPVPVLKDSGNRREFETGAVRDMPDGKGRMDLLPWAAILAVSKHCENGAKKYGEHNVDKGISTNSLCDSAARHLAKYLDGQKDEDHLIAAAWNLLYAVQMREKKPDFYYISTGFMKLSKP